MMYKNNNLSLESQEYFIKSQIDPYFILLQNRG